MTWSEMGKCRRRRYKAAMGSPDTTQALRGALAFALIVGTACGDGENLPLTRSDSPALPQEGAGSGGRPPETSSGGRPGRTPFTSGLTTGAADAGAGSDGELPMVGGAGGDDGVWPTTDGGAPVSGERCSQDSDCDDGVYCNGLEACIGKTERSQVKFCKKPESGPCGPHACDELAGCDCSDLDADNDGFRVEGCAKPNDELWDCDDTDGNRRPRNNETCDGDPEHDEDCDDTTFGDDGDGDLFIEGKCANVQWYQLPDATPDSREKNRGEDCDDDDPEINPDAQERCDEVDNNCNGVYDEVFGAPEGDVNTFYLDFDDDLWGDPNEPLKTLCNSPPHKYVVNPGDCNDHNREISKDREEVCNGVDDDCDGTKDRPLDDDGLMFDEPFDGVTEFECTGESGWKVKTCPPGRLDCGDHNVLDACETIGTTMCNCQACGVGCGFSCGETACEELAEIAAGLYHTCAIARPVSDPTAPGTVACWGQNVQGQLGTGTIQDSSIPVAVQDLLRSTAIASGDVHTCAIADGSLYCWGNNYFSQLGSGLSIDFSPTPLAVRSLYDGAQAKQVVAGPRHTCAIYDDGVLACWGTGDYGQLGNDSWGESAVSGSPIRVRRRIDGLLAYLNDAAQVAVGYGHTCSLSLTGAVECWGANYAGQLGQDPTTVEFSAVPLPVLGLENLVVDEVIASGDLTCVRSRGDVLCWGSNWYGELARDDLETSFSPVTIPLPSPAQGIAVNPTFVCALTSGSVYCWGSNYYGERGSSGMPADVAPTAVPLPDVTRVFGGNGYHVCALRDNSGWCWGRNQFGQLGLGAASDDMHPVPYRLRPLSGSSACSEP
jgi:alpha-tubulin suppressor-like RCC1 family protein